MPLVNNYAIIAAAGTGSRMGTATKKQYLALAGLPVLVHTLKVFENSALIKQVVLVVGQEEIAWCQRDILEKFNFTKVLAVVPGGAYRQHSVYNGLMALSVEPTDIVLVHDGARPLVTEEVLAATINGARELGAAVAAVPVKDTIKKASTQGVIIDTPPREELWAVQTPQAFQYQILMNAYQQAEQEDFIGTDDASLVERSGHEVHLVNGSYENIKITTLEDMAFAEAILKRRGV